MRRGASRQIQLPLQGLEGPGPAVVVGRPLQAMAHERLAGVVLHGLRGGHASDPDRHPPGHRTLPPVLEVGDDRIGVGGHGRDQNLAGHPRRRVGVDVDQDALHELGRGQVLGLVDEQGRPAHHLARADVEDLDGGLQLVTGQPEHIEVLGSLELHLAHGIGRPDRLQLVPEHRGPFELEGDRRLLHRRARSRSRAGVSPRGTR